MLIFKCPNCGGNLKYDRSLKLLVCDACGSQHTAASIGKASFDEDGGISAHSLEIYEKALSMSATASTAEAWATTAEMFELIPEVFESQQLADQCRQNAAQLKTEEKYNTAVTLSQKDDSSSLIHAIQLFSSMPDYKDSATKQRQCEQRLKLARSDEQKAELHRQRREAAKQRTHKFISLLVVATIILGVITLVVRQARKYDPDLITVKITDTSTEYDPDASPYINGCWYINFDFKITNGTLSDIDYMTVVTYFKDDDGKLIMQMSSEFGGYGSSSMDLKSGDSIKQETYLSEHQPEKNESFVELYEADFDELDVSYKITYVKFDDGEVFSDGY
ncbi:MAG: hypothetical protein J6S13_07245 [Clostridia bacterium]|nr:hypothetical protein [Clostridia bacterium]